MLMLMVLATTTTTATATTERWQPEELPSRRKNNVLAPDRTAILDRILERRICRRAISTTIHSAVSLPTAHGTPGLSTFACGFSRSQIAVLRVDLLHAKPLGEVPASHRRTTTKQEVEEIRTPHGSYESRRAQADAFANGHLGTNIEGNLASIDPKQSGACPRSPGYASILEGNIKGLSLATFGRRPILVVPFRLCGLALVDFPGGDLVRAIPFSRRKIASGTGGFFGGLEFEILDLEQSPFPFSIDHLVALVVCPLFDTTFARNLVLCDLSIDYHSLLFDH